VIEVHERFDVPSDPRTVWAVISNPEAVVGCVPGASLGERHEDGSYDGSLTVRFGPVRVTINAQIWLELDDTAMTGRLTAQGRDSQGGTRMKPEIVFKVASHAGGSTVAIDGAVDISGRLAGMIEGGASAVVSRMSSEFAGNLAERCAGSG
jgi:carbon monoxide dehydrogenase subunit G